MIKAKGTLRIKKIRQSRNGAFCIADLSTDFGEFKVKDPLLDQFEEGEYQGTVWISEIYLSQYIAYGKAVTEMRARLHDLQIDSEDRQVAQTQEPIEPDPMDEPAAYHVKPTPTPAPAPAAAPTARSVETPQSKSWSDFKKKSKPEISSAPTAIAANVPRDNLVRVFDPELVDLVEKRAPIKLDPTTDRARLREQISALQRYGYDFVSKEQIWTYPTS